MLIVSNFHDYYDTAMSHGIDKSVVYNRKTNSLLIDLHKEKFNVFRKEEIKKDGYVYTIKPFLIGFCGNMYFGIRLTATTEGGVLNIDLNIYDFDEYKLITSTREITKESWCFSYYRSGLNIKTAKELFNPKTWDHYVPMFESLKVPAFVIKSHGRSAYDAKAETNPRLGDYSFYRVKDPYSAHQDLYMYISGVLGIKEKPMVVLSESDKLSKKGFDGNSFKRGPGGPTRKRKGKK